MLVGPRSATLLATMLAATIACSGPASDPEPARAGDVDPGAAPAAPDGKAAAAATAAGSANLAVTWSVQEATGGTVGAAGLYTAPQASGTYHVVVTSAADPTVSAAATVTVTAPPPQVAVAISPATTTVAASGTATFTATVTGTTNGAVTWSMQEATGCGSVSAAGVYTAPAAAATCHVVATSAADTTRTAVATVTVSAPPVVVAVTPLSGAVNSCRSLTFTASVTGTTNGAVSWSVQEGAAGGTITSGGVYTAPAVAGTYHVVATSQADTTRSQVATVVVTDKVLAVTVNPASSNLTPGQTAQFTATVTTTCGTFAAQ